MRSNVSIVSIYKKGNGGEREKGTRLIFKEDVDGPINSDIEMARNKNGKHFSNGIQMHPIKKLKSDK